VKIKLSIWAEALRRARTAGTNLVYAIDGVRMVLARSIASREYARQHSYGRARQE